MCVVRSFLGGPLNNIHFFCPSSEPVETRIERSETDGGQSITRLADKLRLENRACSAATGASLHLVPKKTHLANLCLVQGGRGCPAQRVGPRVDSGAALQRRQQGMYGGFTPPVLDIHQAFQPLPCSPQSLTLGPHCPLHRLAP